MDRSLLLALVALCSASAGCLNEFEEPEKPHFVRIANIDVQPERVLSQDVLLNVSVTLDNRGGGASDPIRLEAKAYSEERGFLLVTNETDVGSVSGDTTREVPLGLRVPREGGVRIEVVLFEADLGKERASVTARNLGSLAPEVFDTGLRVSDVDFLVAETTNESGSTRARIETLLYVTNEGDSGSEDLQVQVKAREVQTGLVADVGWVGTGSVAPAATVIRSVNLTVPDGYNYVFEIVMWRGQTIVARSEGTVQLAPTFVKPTGTEIVTTDPKVDDFVSRGPTPGTAAPGFHGGGTPAPAVPGPSALALLLALGAGALVLRRRR